MACDFEKIAEKLWQTLDDIDTADDRFRGNNEGFRQYVRLAVRTRFEVAGSDGQQIAWKSAPTNVGTALVTDTVYLVWVNDNVIDTCGTMESAEAVAAAYRVSHPHKNGWTGESPRWHQPGGPVARLWIETREIHRIIRRSR